MAPGQEWPRLLVWSPARRRSGGHSLCWGGGDGHGPPEPQMAPAGEGVMLWAAPGMFRPHVVGSWPSGRDLLGESPGAALTAPAPGEMPERQALGSPPLFGNFTRQKQGR